MSLKNNRFLFNTYTLYERSDRGGKNVIDQQRRNVQNMKLPDTIHSKTAALLFYA